MTQPAVTIPLTPERVAGEFKTLQGTSPILLPAGIPASWTPQVATSATSFSVLYTGTDATESFGVAISIPNPPTPSANTTQRTLTFRNDPRAFYQAQDGTVGTTRRYLTWSEPGVWAGADSAPPSYRTGTIPYYMWSQGLTDSQFWTIANSLRTVTTVAAPTSPLSGPTVIEASAVPLSSVRWDDVSYPLECGTTPQGPVPTQVLTVIHPQVNPGTQLAAVLVTCQAGAGTPPRVLYVYDRATSPTTPHLLQTLSDDRTSTPATQTTKIYADGPDVTAIGSTYSSPTLPRCCPDGTFTARWAWTGSGYRKSG